MNRRVALRQEQAAVVGSEECAAVAAREETPPGKIGLSLKNSIWRGRI